MSNRLYVGNLPYTLTASELQQIFAEYGTVVSAHVVSDRETGRSRGFGFVEMDSREAFQAALDGANGRDVGGRQLSVTEARERPPREGGRPPGGPRPPGGGFGGERRGPRPSRGPDREESGGGRERGGERERGWGRDESRRRDKGRGDRFEKRRDEGHDRSRRERFKDFPGDEEFG